MQYDEYYFTCRRRITQALLAWEKAKKFQLEAIKLFGSTEPELLRRIEEIVVYRQKILNDADHYLLDHLNRLIAVANEQIVRE